MIIILLLYIFFFIQFISTTRRHLDIAGDRRHNYYTYNNIPNYWADRIDARNGYGRGRTHQLRETETDIEIVREIEREREVHTICVHSRRLELFSWLASGCRLPISLSATHTPVCINIIYIYTYNINCIYIYAQTRFIRVAHGLPAVFPP